MFLVFNVLQSWQSDPTKQTRPTATGSRHRSYLYALSRLAKTCVQTAPKYGKKSIRYVKLHFQNFPPLQKSRHHIRSYVWAVALSVIILVAAQKISTIVWTYLKLNLSYWQVQFSYGLSIQAFVWMWG